MEWLRRLLEGCAWCTGGSGSIVHDVIYLDEQASIVEWSLAACSALTEAARLQRHRCSLYSANLAELVSTVVHCTWIEVKRKSCS